LEDFLLLHLIKRQLQNLGMDLLGTPVSSLNTSRNLGGVGTQTAALAFGGGDPLISATESWNGTSWTSVNSLNTARVI
jgi:hypothetical protein